MPTVLSTVSVHGIIGLECTLTSSTCVIPAQAVPLTTPQRASFPSSWTIFQSRCFFWSYLSMRILRESTLALMAWRYTWLHAMAWLDLPLWNPSSILIPKPLHRVLWRSNCAMVFVKRSFWTSTANFLGSAVKRLTSFKSNVVYSQATTITQWWLKESIDTLWKASRSWPMSATLSGLPWRQFSSFFMHGILAQSPVISRLDMYRTNVLMYRTMVLLVRPTKVRC